MKKMNIREKWKFGTACMVFTISFYNAVKGNYLCVNESFEMMKS